MLVGAGIGVTPCSSILKGVINYRWKKGFSPYNLHFYWVARLTDLQTFKWLLITLPELKRLQLLHNTYYAGEEEAQRKQLSRRLKQLQEAVANDASIANRPPPSPAAALPPGWSERRSPRGELYYLNELTNQTSWVTPSEREGQYRFPLAATTEEEMRMVQAALKQTSHNLRTFQVTLYLTGCKPEQIQPTENPKKDSTEELINALLSTRDPQTNMPYMTLKAGRPDWDGEFKEISSTYGREDVGVVFCGAPMIAAALKDACEKHSQSDRTVFRLHKENF